MEENDEEVKVPKKKKSLIKRLFKFLLYTILGFIGLNVLLYFLLSIPAIQQKVANFAVNQLKSKLQTEVSIDEVRLSLFNHATLKGVYIEDQSKDTLLYAQFLDVQLSPWELLRSKKLAITSITLDDFLINVSQKDSISNFNFQFVIDAFASTDTTKVDTTKSALTIVIEDIDIKNGRLNYNVLNKPATPGLFNASHISLYDVNANVDLNSIDIDKLDVSLNKLTAKERSGLEITSLTGKVYSEKSQLWVDNLSLSLPNSHLKTNQVRYNLSTSEFEIGTEDTEIAGEDFTSILPNLKYLTHKISLKTNIKGTLPFVNMEKISLNYGEDCILEGKASISSYEKYGEADIDLSIDKFSIQPNAVTAFARIGDSTFVAPDILKSMGTIFLKGKLNGKLSGFRLNTEAWTRQGAITLLANGAIDTTFTNFNVNARLNTQNFNLGRLLNQEKDGIGKLSMHVNLNARQSNKQSLTAQLQGVIDALEMNERESLKNVNFNGFYNPVKMGLTAQVSSPTGSIFADVDMTQAAVPDINVRLNIDTFKIDRIYVNEAWKNPLLSLRLDGHIKGLDIDNMSGRATIDSLDFHGDNFNFRPGLFTLELGRQGDKNDKYISFTSSLLTANIRGQYKFLTLANEFSNLMYKYMPSVFEKPKYAKKDQNNFDFSISAQNTEELGKIFALPVDIIVPANINGRINTIDHKITINGNIPHLKYGEMDIKDTKLDVANLDSAFNITLGSQVHMDNGIYNLALNVNGAKDEIHSLLKANSDSAKIDIKGQIEALAKFNRSEKKELVSLLQFVASDIKVGKLNLNLLPGKITNIGERTEISNVGVNLNNKKYIGANGVISRENADSIKVYFEQAQVGDLLEAFDVNYVHGVVNGDIVMTNILEQPELYTKGFKMTDIIVFKDTLGSLDLESEWSNELKGIKLNASLHKEIEKQAEIKGMIYTNQDSLDLKVHLDKLPIGWMKPFVADMVNQLSGTISTDLTVEGSMKEPKVKGFFGFNEASVGIDYTNVVYTISDTIDVTPDKIGFDNLRLKDSQGHTARVSATVTHKNFADMKYTVDMNMTNLMVLNTENRTDSLFYGRVFASGSVKIVGDDNNINMNMQIRNDKNSTLNILVPQTSEATDYKSVVYINVPQEKLIESNINAALRSRKSDALPLKLNVKLNVTSDLTLGIIIDPNTGDAMEVRGNGNINFSYDMRTENMTTFGDYTLTDGNVRFNLQNIKRLDFRIREGGKLNFIGDPLKTNFNIAAFRRVRADLKTLDPSFESDLISTRVQVDCILGISGNMDKMNLTYDISLVDSNDDFQRKLNSLINTDEQKIIQFAYLIASGSFHSSSSTSGANFTEGMWTNMASSALSNGLNAAFGNILGDKWEIGTNIESNDGTMSNMDMSVNVSTKFLDDKLKLNTNLGYRTENSATMDNSFIGDFDVEYQLSNVWTLKAYNHANDSFYRQAPYTQGVGIVYTKEASTLKRLFQSFRRRRRMRTQQENQTDSTKMATDSLKITTDSIKPIVKQPIINEKKK
ncbi:translocation/assembly module TamB domain-containing protein [Dysgonomonas sp. ZJ709]|uniref:translocation/assembly module TamB domain-containing protein n=1 Tax=Dysgonomonas sp. ZJ709 TaxID=2709797 RepID=UPI0013EC9196|nr:translocation/assembly module TamB domain-containing protein [Dysgonomonas sp. ZJ709]